MRTDAYIRLLHRHPGLHPPYGTAAQSIWTFGKRPWRMLRYGLYGWMDGTSCAPESEHRSGTWDSERRV